MHNFCRQEGVPENIYERVDLTVELEDGSSVNCLAYKLQDSTRELSRQEHGDKLLPSLKYKNVIIQGAKEHSLPPDYIAYLSKIPDNGYNGEVDVNIPLNL